MLSKTRFSVAGKRILLYGAGHTAPLVLLHTVQGEGEEVYHALQHLTQEEYSLALIDGLDWEGEMSPWPITPLFKKDKNCTGGADGYLSVLTGEILTAILAVLPQPPVYMALAGYSLAGLFALYAAYRTKLFSRLACVSGSFWYPDFLAYAEHHDLLKKPEKIYFSLGDREAKTRHRILSTVEENTRRLAAFYHQQGIRTIFELNEGNHFQQSEMRTAKGIAWMLTDKAIGK
ncbi:MAG: hypothetical protein K6F95_05200 [Selenomonas sp.]|uniref:alpha/beta hydrolase-fold protein n=1 Tax=Selenomonas sp. TaxID=2053611 RepID=UPI0025F2A546|nr:alpha/beta hydrolase-fold protein [Selenomonas sp.]MCR5757285.1 hypothetical protein [Selenomonas sp.]